MKLQLVFISYLMGITEQMELQIIVRMLYLGELLLKCILQSENRQTWAFIGMFNRIMESKLGRGFAAILLMYRTIRKSVSIFKVLTALGWRCFQVPQAS